MKTPGAGLMTLNAKFWGRDPEAAQLEVLKRFDNLARIKPAVQAGKAACLKVLAGVVNHIAPAGQRMPELQAITLLEQLVPLPALFVNEIID